MDKKLKLNLIYAIIAVFGILTLQEIWVQKQTVQPVAYSELETLLKENKIEELTIREKYIVGKLKEPDSKGKNIIIANRVDPRLAEQLSQYNVPFTQIRENTFSQPCFPGCCQHLFSLASGSLSFAES